MRNLLIITFLFYISAGFAQEDPTLLSEGNELFKNKDYTEAEVQYRKKNSKSPLNTVSLYNLGNTTYAINQPLEAKTNFKKVITTSTDKDERYRAFHNLGNVYMQEKKYSQAVEAYKNALRNNPGDEETRYNYALAKQMLEDNPPPQDQEKKKDENKEDKDNKDKDDKEKKEDEESKEDSDKEKESKDKPGEGDPKEKQPEEGKFSKQRMESLLEAINNEEKEIQKKINQQKVKGNPIQQDKNW